MRSIVTVIYIFRLMLLLSFSLAIMGACGGAVDVQEMVVHKLAVDGLKKGYNKGRHIWIAVGEASRAIGNPASNRKFFSERNELHVLAFLAAQRQLIRNLGVTLTACSEMRVTGVGQYARREVSEFSKACAHGYLNGCSVVCSEETWDGNVFSVAVAVSWNHCRRVSGEPLKTECLDEDKARKLAESLDLQKLSGANRFVDIDGHPIVLGIGCADVEGRSGRDLVAAMRLSRTQAIKALAFALYSDVAATEVLEKVLLESADESMVWERFSASVIRRCASYNPPSGEVFDGDIVHRLTGRKIHMTVCGVRVCNNLCKEK